MRLQKPVKPDDQLDLTDAELGAEVTKLLETENLNYPKNLVVYSFKDYAYVPVWHMESKHNNKKIFFFTFFEFF